MAALGGAARAQAQVPDRAAVLEEYRTAIIHVEVTGMTVEGRPARPRLGIGVVVGANGLILTACIGKPVRSCLGVGLSARRSAPLIYSQ